MKYLRNSHRHLQITSGFTLLELLIVIGILAILASALVLVLNPAEKLRQSRDSQRVSDLSVIQNALNYYITAVPIPVLATAGVCGGASGQNFWTNFSGGVTKMSSTTGMVVYGGGAAASSSRAVDGTGWLPVDFTVISGGAPLATLPVDPSGTSVLNYQYMCDATSTAYEIDANLESSRYSMGGGSDDLESTDGGDHSEYYEFGTDPGLNL